MGLKFYCSPELHTMPRKARSCQKRSTRTRPRKEAKSAGPSRGGAQINSDGQKRPRRRGRLAGPSEGSPPHRDEASCTSRRATRTEPPEKRVCRRGDGGGGRRLRSRSSSSVSSAMLKSDVARLSPASEAQTNEVLVILSRESESNEPNLKIFPDTQARFSEHRDTSSHESEFGHDANPPRDLHLDGVPESGLSRASDICTNNDADQHEFQEEPTSTLVEQIEVVSQDGAPVSSDISECIIIPLNASRDEIYPEHIADNPIEPIVSVSETGEAPVSDLNGNVSLHILNDENTPEIPITISIKSTKSDTEVSSVGPTLPSDFIPIPHESEEDADNSTVIRVESLDSVAQVSEFDLQALGKLHCEDQSTLSKPLDEPSSDILFVDLTLDNYPCESASENNEARNELTLEPDQSTSSLDTVKIPVPACDFANTKHDDLILDGANGASCVVSNDFVSEESLHHDNLPTRFSDFDIFSEAETNKTNQTKEEAINEEGFEDAPPNPLDLSTKSSRALDPHCDNSTWQDKYFADVSKILQMNPQALSIQSDVEPILCEPKSTSPSTSETFEYAPTSLSNTVPAWAMPIFQPLPCENYIDERSTIDSRGLETRYHRSMNANNRLPFTSNRAGPSSGILALSNRTAGENENSSDARVCNKYLTMTENILDWSYGEDGQPPPLEALKLVAAMAESEDLHRPAAGNSPNSLSSEDSFHSARSNWDESLQGTMAASQEQPLPFPLVQYA